MPTDEQSGVSDKLTYERDAYRRVVDRTNAARAQHRPFPPDPVRGAAIVAEEALEAGAELMRASAGAVQAALGMTRPRPDNTRRRLIEELTDTAAAAVMALAVQIEELEKESA